ncbi:PREDICTED: uncharacterized protein LOC104825154 [Tarenaya hassleriana]|uniref:uncharacterized protein LOC104825154 n=1 Tax=Tarenaya hassleriana TaxID=28532 RepID=UPI00053C1731|nr:PREDICTED: uncharacterized protein LOC104825154 [Tarenaya hassleriana]
MRAYKKESFAPFPSQTHVFQIPSPQQKSEIQFYINMLLRIKTLLLLFLFLVSSSSSSSGIVEHSIDRGGSMHEILYEVKNKKVNMDHRKLMFESTLDYDDAGPNPKHDPRRKPGGKP